MPWPSNSLFVATIFDFVFFGAADAGGFLYADLETGFGGSFVTDFGFCAVFSVVAYTEPFAELTLFTGVVFAEARDLVSADSSLP